MRTRQNTKYERDTRHSNDGSDGVEAFLQVVAILLPSGFGCYRSTKPPWSIFIVKTVKIRHLQSLLTLTSKAYCAGKILLLEDKR